MSDQLAAAVAGGGLGILGTILLWLTQRYFTRGDRAAKQAKADAKQKADIESASVAMGNQIRDELRQDNRDLRDRLSKAEANIQTLTADRDALRKENLDLTEKNGAAQERIAQLVKQNESMEVRIKELEVDRQILIDALRLAQIPLPPELYRSKAAGTGPLGKGN